MNERGKSEKQANLRKYMLFVFQKFVVPLMILTAISFPFVLDYLYGKGMLAWFNNAFSADVWFSFIGSYFPATIIGILSLYQAYIIQYQEKRYKNLLNRHRFIPAGHANVYRYVKEGNKIGNYSFYDISQILGRCRRNGLLDGWEKGYIVECEVYSSTGIGIKKTDVIKIEWEINGEIYCQGSSSKAVSAVKRVSHSQQQIVIFWLFDDRHVNINRLIEQCMVNKSRRDIRFDTSIIVITLQINDDEDESCELKLRFVMNAQENRYQMSSVEEYYCVR